MRICLHTAHLVFTGSFDSIIGTAFSLRIGKAIFLGSWHAQHSTFRRQLLNRRSYSDGWLAESLIFLIVLTIIERFTT